VELRYNKNMMLDNGHNFHTECTIDKPLNEVKDSIEYLLAKYPMCMCAKKNGVNRLMGTYFFERPKGVDTCSLLVTVKEQDEKKTNMNIECSTVSMTYNGTDLQKAVNEFQNILTAKLFGNEEDVEKAVKENNSGNGIGCVIKTIIYIVLILVAVLYVIYALL
jgi:outer membrane translocation and assembly module TamA